MSDRPKEVGIIITKSTAVFGLIILVLQVVSTIGSWMRPIVSYGERMTNLENARGVTTTQITNFVKENADAHCKIEDKLGDMDGKLENLCGQVKILVDTQIPQRTVWFESSEKQPIN